MVQGRGLNVISAPTPEVAVAAGIQYLDAWHPNWRDKVDADRLNLGHPRDCVMGQVLGSMEAQLNWSGAHTAAWEMAHGFLPFFGYAEEWRRRLTTP